MHEELMNATNEVVSDYKVTCEDFDQESYLKMLGFNPGMFISTADSIDQIKTKARKLLEKQIRDVLFGEEDQNQSKVTIKALIQPFAELDLRLDNLKYEKFDKENVFVANFTKQATKVFKQWKESL